MEPCIHVPRPTVVTRPYPYLALVQNVIRGAKEPPAPGKVRDSNPSHVPSQNHYNFLPVTLTMTLTMSITLAMLPELIVARTVV